MSEAVVFIVDDDAGQRYAIRRTLADEGYSIHEFATAEACLAARERLCPHVVLLDVAMPGMGGVKALEELTRQESAPEVVMLTAFGSERLAVECVRKGAYDYLPKGNDIDELRAVVRRAVEKSRLESENRTLRLALAGRAPAPPVLGASPAMVAVERLIERIAPSDVTVLVSGESGTGKEVVAREIHRLSPRRERALVALNCAALPEDLVESELFGHEKGSFTGATDLRRGRFEQADGGTLFLDEVGDMAPRTQSKLLRVLQERCFERLGGARTIAVDVRLIAATNKDLREEVAGGRFREDLFYRLKVADIQLPPLRARREDIVPLALTFLRVAAAREGRRIGGFTPAALERLQQARWPGNVRELKNAVEYAAVLSDGELIGPEFLPADIAPAAPEALRIDAPAELAMPWAEARKNALEVFERRYIEGRLRQARGNVSEAAREMGLARQSLQAKLKELGLDPGVYRLRDSAG